MFYVNIFMTNMVNIQNLTKNITFSTAAQ